MPVITYVAVDRGELASGHTATTQYQIETDLQQFDRKSIPKGSFDETLSGRPEGWLDAFQKEWSVVSDIILPADLEDWREFISSVCNREQFQIDPTGTIASPGTDINVWLTDREIPEPRILNAGYRYSFNVKAYPS